LQSVIANSVTAGVATDRKKKEVKNEIKN
jgi:hypothetical protein